jgi:hypothetical protein
MCSQLPSWVCYLQALLVPVVAVVGAGIAIVQMMIAWRRFQHDEFYNQYDKRFAVYAATRDFLAKGFQGQISEADIRAYGLHTLDAKFLFDDDGEMFKYLDSIRYHVAVWQDAESHLEGLRAGEDRDAWEGIRKENVEWIRAQDRPFDLNFGRFLKYRRHRWPWG